MNLSDADKPLEPVFTAFGYAAFWAFMWEAELAALACTLKRIHTPAITPTELDQFDALLRSKRTAGQMIERELDGFLVGQDALRTSLKKITESRNRLIHRFYEEQIPNLNSEDGRSLAVREIESLSAHLRAGCALVRDIYMQLACAKFQDVDTILKKSQDDALSRWEE
ncbi:MAG TPA: hypothetical protein VGD88_06605 [Opitutaceae bacterium]